MNFEEKTISSEYLYKGKIINLRKDIALLPNGEEALREVIEHPGGVAVAPLTEDGGLLMVRQFRYPYKEVVLEVPAGKLSAGEIPLECGKRELKEETGATAQEYINLGVLYPSPGYVDEKIYLYAAKGLTFGTQSLDDDEFLSVESIPLERAVDMALSGEITDAKTLAIVLKIYAMQNRGEM
jgi:ADP-ribose pyrophosphatase